MLERQQIPELAERLKYDQIGEKLSGKSLPPVQCKRNDLGRLGYKPNRRI